MTLRTIYDHPLYYDVLFGWDRDPEADFYHRALLASGAEAGAPVLEVACGTGQVARRLAARGWRVTGLDVRPAMLAFLRERAAEDGVAIATLRADMAAFEGALGFAAAYNPLSSFRLLRTDAEAESHLRSVAAALRPRGVYLLDLDLAESLGAPPPTTDEVWELRRGRVRVRAENEAVYVDDGGVRRALAWGTDGHLRAYTASTFEDRVEGSGAFLVESWHPETKGADGTSRFDIGIAARRLGAGRGVAMLRRRT